MSAVTILGVELRDVEPGAGCIYTAETPVGCVAVYLIEAASPTVVWRWDLSSGGETLIRGYGASDTLEAACADADAQLSRLLAIGRAQGLREAAGICDVHSERLHATGLDAYESHGNTLAKRAAYQADAIDACMHEIAAAAERAERGGD
jgi:hypothetical protein